VAARIFYGDLAPDEKRSRLEELAAAGDTNAAGYLASLGQIAEPERRRRDGG
jgi:hypothetical protein